MNEGDPLADSARADSWRLDASAPPGSEREAGPASGKRRQGIRPAPRSRPHSAAAPAPPPLVLASRSPRRAALLRMLGLDFDIVSADVDESLRPGEAPPIAAERLAQEKAGQGAARRPDALVVGCDTIVVFRGEVLGKPRDAAEAVDMLMRLQGDEHNVETGIAIVAPDGRLVSSVEGVRVRFRPFERRVAEEYVATGEPMDKAGAYGIQGFGATLVEMIDGDFFAVMGLPVARMMSLFRALGWRYNFRGFVPLD